MMHIQMTDRKGWDAGCRSVSGLSSFWIIKTIGVFGQKGGSKQFPVIRESVSDSNFSQQ